MNRTLVNDGLRNCQCSKCTRVISWDCFSLLHQPLCIKCSKEIVGAELQSYGVTFLSSLFLLVVSVLLSEFTALKLPRPTYFLIFGLPYGWSFIAKITSLEHAGPYKRSFMTFLRLIGGLLLGWIVCPYEISLSIKALSDFLFVSKLKKPNLFD